MPVSLGVVALTQCAACPRPHRPLPHAPASSRGCSRRATPSTSATTSAPWSTGSALQQEFDAYYFVADLHALTVPTDPAVLRHRTRVTAAQFIAGGVDPETSAVFCQSHVSQHAELGWVLACQTAMGEMSRMTQYKDKTAKGHNANVGLFTYPVLMAADILMYDAAFVPVGEDQRQHLEITRDLAERMNARFGPVLTVPEPYIVKGSAKIMDLQEPTAKMSGSGRAHKGLVDCSARSRAGSPRTSARPSPTPRPRCATTPRPSPGCRTCSSSTRCCRARRSSEVEADFAGRGYGDLKKAVAEVVVEAVTPFQRADGRAARRPGRARPHPGPRRRARAVEVARATMARVRDAVGSAARGVE